MRYLGGWDDRKGNIRRKERYGGGNSYLKKGEKDRKERNVE